MAGEGEWGALWGQGVGVEEFCGWIVGTFGEWQGWNANWIFTRKLGQGQAAHWTGCTGGCETLETVFVKSFTAQLKEYIPVKYAICMNILIY